MTTTDNLTLPLPQDAGVHPGQGVAANCSRGSPANRHALPETCIGAIVHASAAGCAAPTTPPDPVHIAIHRMDFTARAALLLLELDPSLATRRERLRLRLLVDRVLNTTKNPVTNEALGKALTDLHQMHERGFPVRAFGAPDGPCVGRDEARRALSAFRLCTHRALPDERSEATHVETTLDFLKTRSTGTGDISNKL